MAVETIFAPSSGTQRSGVCVLRVSGPNAGLVMHELVGGPCLPRQAALRKLREPVSGEPIDQCLVLWFEGPESFTGEDVVELHVHGGRAVIDASLRALGTLDGFRLAEPGEFARRAFENGKLDLSEVEGLADLINAQTEAQRRLAFREADGRVRHLYETWREQLLQCLTYVEADVDFVDEDDVPEDISASIAQPLNLLLKDLELHLADPRQGEVLRNGFRVVLAGLPNVGKSSLLNAIADRDVVIVTETAGTTRDVVEVFMDLGGFPVVLCDTAGLRAAGDEVERIGVKRAEAAVGSADLVVWVGDEHGLWPSDMSHTNDSDAIWIRNKSDLGTKFESDMQQPPISASVCAQTGEGIPKVLSLVQEAAARRLELTEEMGVTRQRHADCVRSCVAHIREAVALSSHRAGEIELLAEELRLAARSLARVGGQIDVEDVLDRIFGEFCIGK